MVPNQDTAPRRGSSSRSAPRALTRAALYEQVWSQPLAAVAAELGLSRSGLAKICDRVLIPCPGRGHWKARNAPATGRPALPQAPPHSGELVTFSTQRAASRRPRTRLSREARAEQLIDAAGRVIESEGLAAVTLKRIAREVGVSETQAHNHFSGRSDLLIALARRELAAMSAEQIADAQGGKPGLSQVRLSTIAYLRQISQRGALVQTLLNSPEVRLGLRGERASRRAQGRRRAAERMNSSYGVAGDVGYATTAALTAVCLRAGRLIAGGKITLADAERLSLAIINAGNRMVVDAARSAA
jgi:AcrR family transcriptional regulator